MDHHRPQPYAVQAIPETCPSGEDISFPSAGGKWPGAIVTMEQLDVCGGLPAS
jgi:hypothetical protein